MIGNRRVPQPTPRPPRNEELRLTDVGAHIPEMRSDRVNCAVCSKKIRNAHKDAYKDTPKARIPTSTICTTPKHFLQCVQCVSLYSERPELLEVFSYKSGVLEIDVLLGCFHQAFPPFSMLLLAFKLRIAISET